MKFLANILTKSKFNDFNFYNVVDNINDLIEDIPTLIIGWKFANELYDNLNILEHKISDNVYWTFGKREKREQMEKDILKFKTLALNNLINGINYSFFNILTEDIESKKEFYKELTNCSDKTIYTYDNMMYIYYDKGNFVYGLSLRDIEYENGNIKKLFSKMYKCDNIKFIDNKNEDVQKIKYFLKNNLYIVPYICS